MSSFMAVSSNSELRPRVLCPEGPFFLLPFAHKLLAKPRTRQNAALVLFTAPPRSQAGIRPSKNSGMQKDD